jgi:hypothetical protein
MKNDIVKAHYWTSIGLDADRTSGKQLAWGVSRAILKYVSNINILYVVVNFSLYGPIVQKLFSNSF